MVDGLDECLHLAEIKGVTGIMPAWAWMQRCASFGLGDPDGAHRCFCVVCGSLVVAF